MSDVGSTMTIRNAAVFFGKSRQFTGATVSITETHVSIGIRNGRVSYDYEIVETVKAGMAWDVNRQDQVVRLVVQPGCGCGGMRRYVPDPAYSGRLTM